jgi:hypothetical protein
MCDRTSLRIRGCGMDRIFGAMFTCAWRLAAPFPCLPTFLPWHVAWRKALSSCGDSFGAFAWCRCGQRCLSCLQRCRAVKFSRMVKPNGTWRRHVFNRCATDAAERFGRCRGVAGNIGRRNSCHAAAPRLRLRVLLLPLFWQQAGWNARVAASSRPSQQRTADDAGASAFLSASAVPTAGCVRHVPLACGACGVSGCPAAATPLRRRTLCGFLLAVTG